MAKPTGPLFSLSASGSLAKTIVFGAWKGINYVRQRVIPANPRTDAQKAVRAIFTAIVALWKSATRTANDRNAWNKKANKRFPGRTGFNAFFQTVQPILEAEATVKDIYAGAASLLLTTATIIATSDTAAFDVVAYLYNKAGSMIASKEGAFSGNELEITWTNFPGTLGDYIEIVEDAVAPNMSSGYYTVVAGA